MRKHFTKISLVMLMATACNAPHEICAHSHVTVIPVAHVGPKGDVHTEVETQLTCDVYVTVTPFPTADHR